MIKKTLFILFVSILPFSVSCSSGQQRSDYTGPKQTIAIPAFADLSKTSIARTVLDSLTDNFTTQLIKTGRFAIVERTRLNEILKEHELAMTGVLGESDAMKLGKLAQTPYIVLASINSLTIENNNVVDDTVFGFSKTKIKVRLTLRVISTTTGASVAAAEVTREETKSGIHMGLDSSTQLKLGSDTSTDNPVFDVILDASSELADKLALQRF